MEEDTPSDISSIDLLSTVTAPCCSPTNCFVTGETNTLKCSITKCSRLVHFKCSQLPAYQVQIHLNNQNNQKKTRSNSSSKLTFICCNCVEVSKDLTSLCQENQEELENTIRERDRMIEVCEYQSEEAKCWKSKYNVLREKSVKTRTIDDLDKKFQQQITAMGESIKSSLLEVIKSSLTKVEEHATVAQRSYADATKITTEATSTIATSGLKSIIKEARYEEIKEKRDHDQRQRNVIIHGVPEWNDEQKENGDKKFVKTIIEIVKIPPPTIKGISRIGSTADANKKRPIKLVLGSEKEKLSLLRSLSALKGNDDYKGVSITEDLTLTERAVLKEWTEKAHALNMEDNEYDVHRVRGNSKNGYSLRKFPRRTDQ